MTEPTLTFKFTQPISMKVFGPAAIWMADVELFVLAKPDQHVALRSLFLRLYPQKSESERKFMLPGTMLALVRPRKVALHLHHTFHWTFPALAEADVPTTAKTLRDAVEDNKLALLLLQTEPALWQAGQNALPESFCTAGEISFALAVPQEGAAQLGHLQDPLDVLNFSEGGGVVAVGSSGITLHGTTRLPWQWEDHLEGFFQLAPVWPTINEGEANYLLELDRERLTQDQRKAIHKIWSNFGALLTPPNEPRPAWVTLATPAREEIPRLTWPLRIAGGQVEHQDVQLDAAAFNLFLSDQSPGESDNPITSLADVQLRLVTARQEGGYVTIRTFAGSESGEGAAELELTAHRQSRLSLEGGSTWEENVHLRGADLAYHPILTAAKIRQDQQLPTPDWVVDVLDPERTLPLTLPLLWGYMPLEDGWAQIPIPNLSEQIYADLELTQVTQALPESSAGAIKGAVIFSNALRTSEGEANVGHSDTIGEQPWSLTLTNAHSLQGEWIINMMSQFGPVANNDPPYLQDIRLAVSRPKVLIDGLLWLSNDRPTVANSLPDMDNWVNGLYSVSLQSVTRGVPFRIPFIERTIPAEGTGSQQTPNIRAILSAAAADPQKRQAAIELLAKMNLPLDVARCRPGSPRLTEQAITAQALGIVETGFPAGATGEERQRVDWRIHVTIDEGPHAGEHLLYVFRFDQLSGELRIYHPCALDLYDKMIESWRGDEAVKLPDPLRERFAHHDIPLSEAVFFGRPDLAAETTGGETSFRTLLTDTKSGTVCWVRAEGDALAITRVGADTFPALATFVVDGLTFSRQTENKRSFAQLGKWALTTAISRAVLSRMVENGLFAAEGTAKEDASQALSINGSITGSITAASPLLWLRHHTLPLVQALPLTQNQTPPNYPSPSRQYAPFEIKGTGDNELRWSFGIRRANGAASWPTIAPAAEILEDSAADDAPFTLQPARGWRKWLDLSLVYLSLPGLIALPVNGGGGGPNRVAQLPLQYRYDLPYADEINALATLSNPKARAEESEEPYPGGGETQRLEPLSFATYADFWEQLANRAALSALSAVTAIFTGDGQMRLRHLVEPFAWPVQLEPKLAEYPGELDFMQADGLSLELTQDAALAGINGHFKVIDGQLTLLSANGANGTDTYRIAAGSMAAQGDSTALHDQRGLKRFATKADGALLRTPIELAGESPAELAAIYLTTTRRPITLRAADQEWQLWFRDLPISQSDQTFQRTSLTDRAGVLSASHQDVNDPEALSRRHDYLQGYEWRLASAGAVNDPLAVVPLKLLGMNFYPLALEVVKVEEQQIDEVQFTGRLQLPLVNEREREEQLNLVTLTFRRDEGSGALHVRDLVGAGEWPLQSEDEKSGVRIAWKAAGITEHTLRFTNLQLKHAFFDMPWTHALADHEMKLDEVPAKIKLAPAANSNSDSALAITIEKLELILHPTATGGEIFGHIAKLRLNISLQRTIRYQKHVEIPFTPEPRYYVVKKGDNLWNIAVRYYGDGFKYRLIYKANKHLIKNPHWIYPGQTFLIPYLPSEIPPVPPLTADNEEVNATRPIFQGSVALDLLSSTLAESSITVHLLGKLAFTTTQLILDHNTLQMRWEDYQPSNIGATGDRLQLLPGMEVKDGAAPGIAYISFAPLVQGKREPELRLRTAHLEGLVRCAWGDSLQDAVAEAVAQRTASTGAAADSPYPMGAAPLLKSSAGDFMAGYSAQFSAHSPPGHGGSPAAPIGDQRWSESLLVNGALEVTNLISWPLEMEYDGEATSLLTLPAAADKMRQMRHTLRILLNQHEIPCNLLVSGEEKETILNLVPSAAWQFLAVTEHQLVAANHDAAARVIEHERRWTVLQEVRIVHPEHFRYFLETVRGDRLHGLHASKGSAPLSEANQGYLAEHVRGRLAEALADVGEILLVEASAHQWVGQQPLPVNRLPASTHVQYLPTGAQLALLSRPQDYAGPMAEAADEQQTWLLLALPFLGRIQPRQLDNLPRAAQTGGGPTPVPTPTSQPRLLHTDPVAHVQTIKLGGEAIPPLLLALTNRGETAAVKMAVSIFDTAGGRLFLRLDNASLQENWMRLQNPPVEVLESAPAGSRMVGEQGPGRIRNIMAALPDTPGRLSRQAAMEWLYSGYRAFYPPRPSHAMESDVVYETPDIPLLLWGADSLFTLQHAARPSDGGAGATDTIYGWHIVGLQLFGSSLWKPSVAAQQSARHPATTVLPPAPQRGVPAEEQKRAWPVTVAVSPYLALEFQRAPDMQKTRPVAVAAELLALDAFTHLLVPIASQLWEVNKEAGSEETESEDAENGAANGAENNSTEQNKSKPLTYAEIMQAGPEWARAVHLRLAPESPVAILRYREIHTRQDAAIAENGAEPVNVNGQTVQQESIIITRYHYRFVENLPVSQKLTKRVAALRSRVVDMRFREGQFGGQRIPLALEDFELAPPQITGVQPIYHLPAEENIPQETDGAYQAQKLLNELPWGLSALWYSTRYTAGSKAVIGARPRLKTGEEQAAATLWWQSTQQLVQYRTGEDVAEIMDDMPDDAGAGAANVDEAQQLLMGAVSGLPNNFRARAIKSLLPVVPQPRLPHAPLTETYASASEGEDNGEQNSNPMQWQAVLPGEMRFMLLGNRPGAMLALRHQVLRQRLDADHQHLDTVVSGSIPVQHRVPRPVPLPANRQRQQAIALRTWASHFDAEAYAHVTFAPADEAFLAPLWFSITPDTISEIQKSGEPISNEVMTKLEEISKTPSFKEFDDQIAQATERLTADERRTIRDLTLKYAARVNEPGSAQRLRLTLLNPANGEIDADWDGTLIFDVFSEREAASTTPLSWTVRPVLTIGATSYTYPETDIVGSPAMQKFELAPPEDGADRMKEIQSLIGRMSVGEAVRIDVWVKDKYDEDNFQQQLSFPVVVTDRRRLRLPMRPYFVHFEDPEYNRRLSTPAAYITALVKEERAVNGEIVTETHTVRLAADRQEYNTTSRIYIRYDWEDERDDKAELTVQVFRNGSSLKSPETLLNPWDAGTLHAIDLSAQSASLKPQVGDTLEITIRVKQVTTPVSFVPITLQLKIVGDPVTPTPEAAYALLRRQELGGDADHGEAIQVECTRFAWGPQATRIELVCPKDLQTEIVRRRAIFQWLDVARPQTVKGYAIQKIAQNGATHSIEKSSWVTFD